MSEFSSILRKTLLTAHDRTNPDYIIGRWKVYSLFSKVESAKGKNMCYEIAGDEMEKVLVMLLFNERNQIYQTKYYFLKSSTDPELAYFLTRSLLLRISDKFQFAPDYAIKELKF